MTDYNKDQLKRIVSEKTKKYNTDECVICQEKYGDNFYVLACNHKFDINCLMQFRKKNCPICRTIIPAEEYEEIGQLCTIELPDMAPYNVEIISSFGIAIELSGSGEWIRTRRSGLSVHNMYMLMHQFNLYPNTSTESNSRNIDLNWDMESHSHSNELPETNPILFRDANPIYAPTMSTRFTLAKLIDDPINC